MGATMTGAQLFAHLDDQAAAALDRALDAPRRRASWWPRVRAALVVALRTPRPTEQDYARAADELRLDDGRTWEQLGRLARWRFAVAAMPAGSTT